MKKKLKKTEGQDMVTIGKLYMVLEHPALMSAHFD
ncbi:hypothetical protein A2U01_0038380, partial [Trifolium medium]|nr:hypothetical protein [Trifolium medium]